MPTRGRHRRSLPSAAFFALAWVALVLKVVVPAGFMIAGPGDGARFPLEICTGHGPLLAGPAEDTRSRKDGDSKSRSDAPCVFAGHAAPPTPAVGAEIPEASALAYAPPPLRLLDLIPGRGLAAPPPPSQGPPLTV